MANTDPELARRRAILNRSIGEPVQLKREHVKPKDPLRGQQGVLLDVKRTRALLDFGDQGEWFVPVKYVLLPGSTEPDPRQIELFQSK